MDYALKLLEDHMMRILDVTIANMLRLEERSKRTKVIIKRIW